MKVTISATWLRMPWPMPIWDAAYVWLVKAGAGEARALKEIENIKLAAQSGNAMAVQVKRHFDAVAKLVSAGLPKPSTFVAQRRRKSPLLPGGGGPTNVARKQQAELAALKRQQLERAKKEKTKKAVQARFAAEKAQHEAELVSAENELEMLRKQLERRDLADEIRGKLEAQAERYEAIIDKLGTPAAAAEATTVSEAAAAERPEAEQDDSAGAYPSGVPGDTEFNDAGV